MKDKKLYFESLLATIMVFALMGLFVYFPFNLKVFNPIKESLKDFKFSDLYYSEFVKDRNQFEDEVILVNIGYADRAEIAHLITTINNHSPSVIAVDVVFPELKNHEGDTLLKKAFERASDRLVLISQLIVDKDGNESIMSSHPFFGNHSTGYANFVGQENHNATVRYFRPVVKEDEETLYAFSTEIVQKHAKGKAETLLSRKKKTEKINFVGNYKHFAHFDYDEVIAGNTDLSALKGKIILLGFMGPNIGTKTLEDAFYSPLNEEISGRSIPDIYGVVIHANILSMILNGEYINKMSKWLNMILAFILCYIHVVFFTYYFVHKHLWYHLFAKIAQLVTSVLLLYIIFQFYSKAHFLIDSTIAVAAILLSVDVLYFYESLAAYFYKKKGIKSYFIHSH